MKKLLKPIFRKYDCLLSARADSEGEGGEFTYCKEMHIEGVRDHGVKVTFFYILK